MFKDARTTFVTDTAVGATTGTELVGDVINLKSAQDIGVGHPVYLHIYVTEAFDSTADGASVEFRLVSDASGSIATNGDATEHLTTGALGELSYPLGKHFTFTVPMGGPPMEQYLGLLAVTSGEALTAGKISAFIALDGGDHWTPFKEGND